MSVIKSRGNISVGFYLHPESESNEDVSIGVFIREAGNVEQSRDYYDEDVCLAVLVSDAENPCIDGESLDADNQKEWTAFRESKKKKVDNDPTYKNYHVLKSLRDAEDSIRHKEVKKEE